MSVQKRNSVLAGFELFTQEKSHSQIKSVYVNSATVVIDVGINKTQDCKTSKNLIGDVWYVTARTIIANITRRFLGQLVCSQSQLP